MIVQRGLFAIAAAAAVAVGPVVLSAPAAADGCPWGTVPSRFEGVCVSGPSSGGATIVNPQGTAGNVVNSPGQLGSVGGVPCTPEHFGTCYGMIQNAP